MHSANTVVHKLVGRKYTQKFVSSKNLLLNYAEWLENNLYLYAHCAQLELQNRVKNWKVVGLCIAQCTTTSQWSDENARLDLLKNDKKITQQSVHRRMVKHIRKKLFFIKCSRRKYTHAYKVFNIKVYNPNRYISWLSRQRIRKNNTTNI